MTTILRNIIDTDVDGVNVKKYAFDKYSKGDVTGSVYNGVDTNTNTYFLRATVDDNAVTDFSTGNQLTISNTATNLSTTLGVTGNTTIGGTIDVTGATTLSSTLDVTSNTTIGGTLGVTGASTLSGPLTVTGVTGITGNTSVTGTLNVTSNTQIGGTLGVTSNASVSGGLTVNNATLLKNNATIQQNLAVSGTSTLTGNSTLGGTLSVTGTSTLTGNTSLGGTLAVTGTSDFTDDVVVQQNLTVNGNLTNTSDQRFKENIVPIKNSLEKVLSLNGVYYYWIDKQKKGDSRQIGLIAQNMQEIAPELVKTDDKGFLSVNYSQSVAILIEAIKEQQEMINNLQKKVEELSNK